MTDHKCSIAGCEPICPKCGDKVKSSGGIRAEDIAEMIEQDMEFTDRNCLQCGRKFELDAEDMK